MSGTIHVFDLLKAPPETVKGGVCALFGGDRFLKLLASSALVGALAGEDDFGVTRLTGESAQWADVQDELATRSLFGGDGARIVVVDNADPFVKNYRDRIEDLIEGGTAGSLLILIVESWAANTRLYKSIDKKSLQVQCEAPVVKRGRSKQRDDSRTAKWLVSRASGEYGFKLPSEASALMIELTECDFGRMDQELAKLSLYSEEGAVSLETVQKVVGGWTTGTMWSAIDAATEGDAATALKLLDQLLKTAQHPLALFGQLSWSLRRYAETAEIVARQQRDGQRVDFHGALKQAGFNSWGGELEKAASRMRQLGRERAFKLYEWLVEADRSLKGTHSREERARLVLEKLFVRMSRKLSNSA